MKQLSRCIWKAINLTSTLYVRAICRGSVNSGNKPTHCKCTFLVKRRKTQEYLNRYTITWLTFCQPDLTPTPKLLSVNFRLFIFSLTFAGNGKVGPLNQVNHTSLVAVVTPTDRPKSVRNRCVIERFCGVVCVVTLPLWHFCWCMGFCHKTESDLFLILFLWNVNVIKYFPRNMKWSHRTIIFPGT